MGQKKSVILGLLCAVLCALFVTLFLADVGAQQDSLRAEALERYGGDQIEVYVAKRDIAAGEALNLSSIERRLWVADLLPAHPVTTLEEVEGHTIQSSILKGEVISGDRLGSPDSVLDVPSGMSAVSVPARDVQALGGALKSGMKADVYATGASGTTLLVQGAQVLATSNEKEELWGTDSVSWITLAVKPERVQELVTAAHNLELYFTLPVAKATPTEAEVKS